MLTLKNLTRIYKMGNVEVKALLDVSLAIEEGDITCIMGKSGSGKSTLLRQLGLIDRPTSGQIILMAGMRPGCRMVPGRSCV